tara:strand:+ start:595 stop:849 length:255 start_codon:yes stop_codon:yes gene_type:complete
MIFYVIFLTFIIVSNLLPIREYMTMDQVEIQHEKNNIEIEELKKKFDAYQAKVDEKFDLVDRNKFDIKKMKKEAIKYKKSQNKI